ncbi:MAG: YajQ family cyclic di-GMP-binding protein [Acidimicrobiaceae bacterium]|nr:YajQ family cyclic di-GMP-binding protein [Acidimicrobiaceae bacterium]
MPTFDVVSEVDMQEVRNAVDQAGREVATRFDFKNTNSQIEISDKEIKLSSSTEDRIKALMVVLEEKLVKRQVSLKALERGPLVEGSKGSVRQSVKVVAGISTEKGKEISKFIRDLALKGTVPSIQGDQLRVSSKKRDDLQTVIQSLKEADFDIPLQFTNFRD